MNHTGADREQARSAVRALLCALGHDPTARPELALTPERTADAWIDELLAGYGVDPAELLTSGSERLATGSAPLGPVAVHDLAVVCVCPHHLLPALGRATVAYVPGGLLIGLGTLTRLVDLFSRRLTFQENIGTEVVQALMQHGQARGAWCRLSMTHTCLCARGARQSGAMVHTSASAGIMTDPRILEGLGVLGPSASSR